MIATIILGIFAVLFAFLAKYKNFRYGLEISFFLIFLFLALRYNFGNDYSSYLKGFIDINRYSPVDYFDKYYRVEPGWIFLCRIFKPLGFFVMIAVLALFNCLVYYRFIKKYVPINYYWLAIFLYIFNPGFMLIHSSAMRQSIAIALFIFSLDYLYKKDAIRYFLCIGIASLFHTSALILLPVYLLGILNWKINKVTGVIFFSFFVSLFIFRESLRPYLSQFISNNFERYEVYQTAGVISTGLVALYLSGLLILTLYYERFQNRKTAFIFKIAIIGFIFIPLNLLIQLISRVGMYFVPATLIAYPIILMNLKKHIYKTIFLFLLIFMTTYQFFAFFNSEVWKDAFGIYQTIFSAPKLY